MIRRTDDQIRRGILVQAMLEPAEIDQWLIEHPRPTLAVERAAILSERLTDAVYALAAGLGIINLATAVGMEPRSWVKDRAGNKSR